MWGSRDSNYRLNFQKDLLENSRQNQEHIKQGNKYFPKSTVHLEKQTVYIMQRNYLKIPNGRGFMYYQIKTVILNITKKSLTTQKLRNIIGEVKFQVESDNGSIDFCLISLNFYIKRKKLSIYLSAHYLSISRAGFFASTRDESLSPRLRLECNPEIPVAPGEEHWLLDTSLDEVYWPCSKD